MRVASTVVLESLKRNVAGQGKYTGTHVCTRCISAGTRRMVRLMFHLRKPPGMLWVERRTTSLGRIRDWI